MRQYYIACRLLFFEYVNTVVIIGSLSLAGCSASLVSDTAALATVGQATASFMQQSAQLSPPLLQQLAMSNAFMKSYRGTAPDEKNITAIQIELTYRANVLNKLASAYAALGSLAGNQPGTDFKTACTSLTADLQAYGTATKSQIISAPAAAESCTVGGMIIGAVQQQQVADAVNKLLPLVTQVVSSFEANRQIYKDLDDSFADEASKATLELYNGGFFTASQLLTTFGAPYGLTPVQNADTMLHASENGAYLTALQSAGRLQIKQQITSVSSTFDASLSALKKLQTQHTALRDGKPIDLSLLLSDLNYVQSITNQMIAAINTKGQMGK
jgi:hypothetical protein